MVLAELECMDYQLNTQLMRKFLDYLPVAHEPRNRMQLGSSAYLDMWRILLKDNTNVQKDVLQFSFVPARLSPFLFGRSGVRLV